MRRRNLRNSQISHLYTLLLLMFFMRPVAFAQKLQRIEQLSVMDASGKKVGPLIGVNTLNRSGAGIVALKVDGTNLAVAVYKDGFTAIGMNPASVVWESTDCSGKPYLWGTSINSSLFPQIAVGLPGNTIYLAENPTSQLLSIRSISSAPVDELSPGGRSQCAVFQIQLRAIPAKALVNLDDEFQPPFTVR